MRLLLLASLILAACGDNSPDVGKGRKTGAKPAAQAAAPSNSDLLGLYERRRENGETDRMCVVAGPDGGARFGLVAGGQGGRSCSGSGTVRAVQGRARIAMTGDRACSFDARIEGRSLVFPDTVPAGCSYYCAAGARLGQVTLARTGTSRADAMKALDLVGDPLCGSLSE